MRVVTTLPSATEIVAALGVNPVGVSHECDYPPDAADAPAVTSARIDASGSSGEIDRRVRASMREGGNRDDGEEGVESGGGEKREEGGGGLFDIDAAALERLDPDLIVTQGVCDVCAVDTVAVERTLSRIDADPAVLTTDPHTVGDVLADVTRIGRAIGREERAAALVADVERRVDAIRERTAGIESARRPRVAVLDWTKPVMVAGHWVPELVRDAGGRYGLADPGDASRPREWDELRAYDPEVLVVAPCGFDLGQTAATLTDLTDREGWDEVTAVREGRVWAMDGDAYVNRPGPRLVDALDALAAICHPDSPGMERPARDVVRPLDRVSSLAGASEGTGVERGAGGHEDDNPDGKGGVHE